MAWARGSALVPVVTIVFVFCFVVQFEIAQAITNYTVGDDKGWTFGVSYWTEGKKFKVGDVLVFKYDPARHNVIKVSQEEYDSCVASDGSKIYNSGNDHINLTEAGTSYFICGVYGHCDNQMAIAVDVEA